MADPDFRKYFGTLQGEELKTAPQGFDKNHPSLDLLRKKSFVVKRNFTDAEVTDDLLLHEVIQSFRAMRPYFDYMSLVLTTNLNGESILED